MRLLPALLTADLHLTQSADAEYRWGLFPWLHRECKAEDVQSVFILGDLTDAKDYHPAEMVNRVVGAIVYLASFVPNVFILMGNHDYLKGGHAYFEFLSHLPNVQFVCKPTELVLTSDVSVFLLPHSKNPAQDWKGMDLSHYNFVFMHQTVKGAVASNGQEMEGEEMPDLRGLRVYSGDIHAPQFIGPVEYVGSPYHVHHGDDFKPRCVLLDSKGRPDNLYFKSIRRLSIKAASLQDLKRFDIDEGDHVKLVLRVPESSKHEWTTMKAQARSWLQEQGAVVNGISLELQKAGARLATAVGKPAAMTDRQRLYSFVESNELGPDALDMGLDLL